MISNLSNTITEALCKSSIIEETDRELYVYGFFVLLSQGLFFLISALFGLLMGTLWESIVFYIMFSTLRCYAGGFHASKEIVCTCCTTAALFLASLSLYILRREENIVIPLCLLASSSAVVFRLSPMDSAQKPLTASEFIDYRRKARGTCIGIIAIAICGWLVHLPGILYAASVSMVLECGLLIFGKASRIKDVL